jgi:hypothetical protein
MILAFTTHRLLVSLFLSHRWLHVRPGSCFRVSGATPAHRGRRSGQDALATTRAPAVSHQGTLRHLAWRWRPSPRRRVRRPPRLGRRASQSGAATAARRPSPSCSSRRTVDDVAQVLKPRGRAGQARRRKRAEGCTVGAEDRRRRAQPARTPMNTTHGHHEWRWRPCTVAHTNTREEYFFTA